MDGNSEACDRKDEDRESRKRGPGKVTASEERRYPHPKAPWASYERSGSTHKQPVRLRWKQRPHPEPRFFPSDYAGKAKCREREHPHFPRRERRKRGGKALRLPEEPLPSPHKRRKNAEYNAIAHASRCRIGMLLTSVP
jgi:hypothetical protein